MSKTTTYNPNTKTWRAAKSTPIYNSDCSLGKIVLTILKKNPDSICQVSADSGVEISCNEMRLRTVKIAMTLQKMGYKQGNLVGVIAMNSENVAPLVFACMTLGLGINFLAPNANKTDVIHMWGIVRPDIIFCDAKYLEIVKDATKELESSSPIYTLMGTNGYQQSIEEFLIVNNEEADNYRPPHLENLENVIGIILCSSGTTGLQKAVSISQKQLTYQMIPFWDPSGVENDVIFNVSPLFWISGVFALLIGTLYCAKRVITSEAPSCEVLKCVIEKYNPTVIISTPYLLVGMLELKDLKPSLSLKNCLIGGSMVPKVLQEKLKPYFPNGKISNIYGSTEIGGVSNMACERIDGVGYLIWNMEMKLLGESGENLGPNEIGEICIKPPIQGIGYLRNPKQTEETYQNGWVHTGDLGRVDDDGYLYFVSRKKEIMKYNNYHVSPAELENIINKIPGVIESCVVGVLNSSGNDIIYAVVRKSDPNLSEDDVINYVNDKVADAKRLRGGVFFVESFPMTASQKIIRAKVKELVELKLKFS